MAVFGEHLRFCYRVSTTWAVATKGTTGTFYGERLPR